MKLIASFGDAHKLHSQLADGLPRGCRGHLHVKGVAQLFQHRTNLVGLVLGFVIGLGIVIVLQLGKPGQGGRNICGPLRLFAEAIIQIIIGKEIMIAMGI